MKKFKDTKVGQFLKEKAPKILDKVGDFLPDSGVLGIVKNLVDTSPDISPEDKKYIYQHIEELTEIELKDRESARNREIEIAKTGKSDLLFNFTGLVGLIVFVFIVYAIVYLEIPKENKEIFIHLIGIAEGIVLSIFGYYFGSAVKKNIQ
jgi:hypothetical protein